MANPEELAAEAQIPIAAQRMWTSALPLRGREFCFILNYALRADTEDLVEPAAIIARGINRLCVQPEHPEALRMSVYHPEEDVCFRGGGFNDDCRDFFAAERKYRQPAYLATSFSEAVARQFIQMRGGNDCVLWRVSSPRECFTHSAQPVALAQVRIDPERKCVHVNLVKRTNVEGEEVRSAFSRIPAKV